MRILLIRHGETSWNVEGRYQGQSFDIPLTGAGRSQAQALAARLRTLSATRAVCSPLLRAQQTASLLLEAMPPLPESLHQDKDLMEINHGHWEGRFAADVAREHPDEVEAWRNTPHTFRIPGGESLQEVQERGWQSLLRACQGLGEEGLVVMVGHDGVNRAILCRVMGLPLSRVWSFRQASTCLNLLEGPDPENLALVRLNDATHIFPLFGETVHRRLR